MPSIRTDHLVSAIENCDQRLRVFRDKYRERVKKYVGRNYSNDGWSNPRPDNGIAMQVNILRRFLVSSNPRILAIPTVPSLASEAASLAESVNARAEAIRLGDTLDMGIVTALLFGMSVTKTCYVPGGYGQPGSPSGVHVDCVDPDDLVLDLSARKIDEVGMIGNRYRLPLEYVRNSPIYNQDVARKLSPNEDIDQTPDGTERASSIGAGGYSSRLYGVVELVDLIDIYLPYDNWFLTMADDRSGRVLRSEPWKGPPHTRVSSRTSRLTSTQWRPTPIKSPR